MVNKSLLNFIKEATKRGYTQNQIVQCLISHRWPKKEIDKAFELMQEENNTDNRITLFLNDETMNILRKRAKKNLFTIQEQIEDILRRSCMVKKNTAKQEKLDDFLLTCFSRKKK
jgi:hypothetical protein